MGVLSNATLVAIAGKLWPSVIAISITSYTKEFALGRPVRFAGCTVTPTETTTAAWGRECMVGILPTVFPEHSKSTELRVTELESMDAEKAVTV